MLRAVLGEDNAEKGVQEITKAFIVKDALFVIAESWDRIKPLTIAECWYNGLPVGSHGSEEDTHPDQRLTTDITENCRQLGLGDFVETEINSWVNCDNNIGTDTLSDDQIANVVTEQQQESTDSRDGKEHLIPTPPPVPVHEAIDSLRLFREWSKAPVKWMPLS
ncbi:hypothetical protein chiPu_0010828 [Chiloscyllium punctatum]|uniref:DDE-1 domain-containing protein n=1 Tax=Chiloscyllium punctatum TaxID=137246 RepID=A0A401SPQ2_CHIPU|nr:hypothetical protein [Chiloscyllium punctatum]